MHSTHSPIRDQEFIVWDVLDPFAPLDPTQHRLRALIQAEITRTRRYENIGPLQPIEYASDTESDDDSDYESDDGDADDEEEDDDGKEEQPARISLPQLLHTRPICYVSSTFPSPTRSTSISENTIGPLRDLSTTDEDEAEAKERARKAKRDAHRSRLKVLAVLGPEAATAVYSMSHGSQF